MKSNSKYSLIFSGIVLLYSWVPGRACSCVKGEKPCEAFGAAKAVFIGKVAGAKEQRESRNADGSKTTYDVGEIYFSVEESFLRVNRPRVIIHSGTGGGDCGYWFRRGQRYLVYAYGDSLDALATNICTRTRLLAEAEEDLAFLRNLPNKGTGARVYGSVEADVRDPKTGASHTNKPLVGVAVKIEGGGKTFEAVTDDQGKYELTGLAQGDYKVYAVVPDYYYKSEYWIQKVHLNDRGCAGVGFLAQNDSGITGRVIKPDGTGVPNAQVQLVPEDSTLPVRRLSGEQAWANENGEYRLDQIAPGRYLLGINFDSSPSNDMPYPRTFYPGVTDRTQATVIEIGLGQKLKDIDLHLPPRALEHFVRGFVVWPDGNPAAGVEIHLEDVDQPNWCVNGCSGKTDSRGRFELNGFDGVSYRIVSMAGKPAVEGKPAQPVYGVSDSFKFNADLDNIKIVLSLAGRPWDKQ